MRKCAWCVCVLRYTWQWRSSWNDWRNGNAKFWYLANKSIRSHTYILNFRRYVWIVNCEWISSSDPILFLYLQPTHCYFILFIIFFAKFTPKKKKEKMRFAAANIKQHTHTRTNSICYRHIQRKKPCNFPLRKIKQTKFTQKIHMVVVIQYFKCL